MFFLLWNPLMQFDGMATPILHFDSFIEAQYSFPQCSFLILTWFLRVNWVFLSTSDASQRIQNYIAESELKRLSCLCQTSQLKDIHFNMAFWKQESHNCISIGHNSILGTFFCAFFVRVYHNDKLLLIMWFSQSITLLQNVCHLVNTLTQAEMWF